MSLWQGEVLVLGGTDKALKVQYPSHRPGFSSKLPSLHGSKITPSFVIMLFAHNSPFFSDAIKRACKEIEAKNTKTAALSQKYDESGADGICISTLGEWIEQRGEHWEDEYRECVTPLIKFFNSLGEDTCLRIQTVMYSGRDRADLWDMWKYLRDLQKTRPPEWVWEPMVQKVPAAEYLREGMKRAKAAGYDIDGAWPAN